LPFGVTLTKRPVTADLKVSPFLSVPVVTGCRDALLFVT
jgi:hypothetical protein